MADKGTDENSGSKIEQVEVARRLRSARETLGFTQEDVASALGIPRTSVIAMEAAKRNVTALEIRRLARLYRREVSWLLGEGPESVQEGDAENQALFRATAQLSEEDKDQVLRFAQFLAAGEAPPGAQGRPRRGQSQAAAKNKARSPRRRSPAPGDITSDTGSGG